MLEKEQILLIVYFILVVLFLAAFTVIFFITYQKRKNKLLQEKSQAEKQYEEEITKSRIEIQEQTLKNVSRELHDNIGQLLSVANLQLNILSRNNNNPENEGLMEIKEIVSTSLQEVRALSKSLNNEVVGYAGLKESVQNELQRFQRLNILKTLFKISGEEFYIRGNDEIILFRILQEFFSNVIKHANATELVVRFNYSVENLHIEVKDNGEGFNPEEVRKSSGLLNMQSRADLIGADFTLESFQNKGTSLSLQYPANQPQYEEKDHNS
ncbi:sensor histidine kinase [Zunongwangia sp. F363]|uniref:histidine kinase n=1 Tax=Autumnicola tepida TaxID=3075595 RepID=A0ABU3CDB1_9FLAO|nr:sensor histidine kinase [Zunongwangia sp. F363]MDT0644328.1 sensor histidine kinase [Zunongwangia sp. F363]